MDSVLKLISYTYTKDQFGVPEPHPASRTVYCKVQSVTRSEFFEGGRNGLNPELVFSVFAGDYNGETVCEHNDYSYGIYRVYRNDGDYVELYAERKGGVNGKGEGS